MDGFGRQKRMDRFGNQTRVGRRRNINPDPQPMSAECQAAMQHNSMCVGLQGTYSSPLNTNYMGCQCGCQPMSGTGITPDNLQQYFNDWYCYCHGNAGAIQSACSNPGGGMGPFPGWGASGNRVGGTGRLFRRGGRVRRRRR